MADILGEIEIQHTVHTSKCEVHEKSETKIDEKKTNWFMFYRST